MKSCHEAKQVVANAIPCRRDVQRRWNHKPVFHAILTVVSCLVLLGIFPPAGFAQPTTSKPGKINLAGGFQIQHLQVLNAKVLPSSGFGYGGHLGVQIGNAHPSYIGALLQLRVPFLGTDYHYGLIPEDVNPYLIQSQATPLDSERVEILQDNFANPPSRRLSPVGAFTYGIVWSPSVYRWGSPTIQIRRSFYLYSLALGNGRRYVNRNDDENTGYVRFETRNQWSMQVLVKPCNFFRPKTKRAFWWGDLLQIGLYGERYALKRASFDDQPAANFFTPAFFQKYGVTYQFGMVLGLVIESFEFDKQRVQATP